MRRSAIAAPLARSTCDRILESPPDLVVQHVREVSTKNTQPRQWHCWQLGRPLDPAERAVEQPRVADGRRDRPCVIERPRQGDGAAEADLAESWLQPDDAAGGGRNPDRAARIGADRSKRHPGGDACRRSAARAAGRARRVVRVAGRAERGFVVRRAECKLVEVGLADDHRPRIARPDDHVRVARGDVAFADAGGRRGRRARHVEEILDRDRDAVQRSAVAARRQLAIEIRRLPRRGVAHDQDERVQPRVVLVDPLQHVGGYFRRAEPPFTQPAREVVDRERRCHFWREPSGTGSCCGRSAARRARVACANASISGRSSGRPRRSASAVAAATHASMSRHDVRTAMARPSRRGTVAVMSCGCVLIRSL